MKRILGLAALILPLTACTVPRGLVEIVNAGAVQHAQEHVAEGNGDEKVLCAIEEGLPDAVGWLIPSIYVATLGCQQSNAMASASECHDTGLLPIPPFYPDVMCSVLALGVAPARSVPTDAVSSGDQTVLDLQLDPEATLAGRRMHECITPSGWRFDYYEPVGGGALPPGADCTRLTVRP